MWEYNMKLSAVTFGERSGPKKDAAVSESVDRGRSNFSRFHFDDWGNIRRRLERFEKIASVTSIVIVLFEVYVYNVFL